jgi:FtsH-binding integral membrane protein
MENNFYKKIYNITLCNFWYKSLSCLGFSNSYFACKNYLELAQARITKVVGFFTMNPTKLNLHFSDFAVILYAIYKNQ